MLDLNTSIILLAAASLALGSQIAVYWGQNSAASLKVGMQTRLRDYCQNTPSDIVMISYISKYPQTELNFANMCRDGFDDDSGLLHCSQIGEDIKFCQSMGKKLLLTLGGDGSPGDYGFPDNKSGSDYASYLLKHFGPDINNGAPRPFDDAVVDGFNIAAHQGLDTPNTAFIKKLKELAPQMLLAAAPNCMYPDAQLHDSLTKAYYDYVFVQFYSFSCSTYRHFNWKTWSNWAKTISVNPKVKVFVGVAGAGKGFLDDKTLKTKVSGILDDPVFGGFSIWDASSAKASDNYAQKLRDLLDGK